MKKILSARVTGDGRVLVAVETEDGDLLWEEVRIDPISSYTFEQVKKELIAANEENKKLKDLLHFLAQATLPFLRVDNESKGQSKATYSDDLAVLTRPR